MIIQKLYPLKNDLLDEEEVNFENTLIMLHQRERDGSRNWREKRIFDKYVRIGPNWEKILFFMDNLSTKNVNLK